MKCLGFYLIQGSFKFVEEECVFVFGRQARVHNICIVNTSLHCMWLNIIKRKSKRLLGQKMIIHDFFLARHNYKTLFKKVIAFNHNKIFQKSLLFFRMNIFKSFLWYMKLIVVSIVLYNHLYAFWCCLQERPFNSHTTTSLCRQRVIQKPKKPKIPPPPFMYVNIIELIIVVSS